jgi:hypothetical protein
MTLRDFKAIMQSATPAGLEATFTSAAEDLKRVQLKIFLARSIATLTHNAQTTNGKR